MSNEVLPNPFDTAMNPPAQVSEWYGQVIVNAWYCALVKGQGKIAWDPNALDPNTGNPPRRNTAIDIKLIPMTRAPVNDLERTVIAEFGEWPDIILPSLKDLGITNLQMLSGQYVRMEIVPTGKTYEKDGQTKNSTTFKFLSVYPNEAACRSAWEAASGGAAAPAQNQPAAAPSNNGNGGQERLTAEKFLKAYVTSAWRNSGKDLDKARQLLTTQIAAQPLLSKYFTVDSPEVMELLAAEATPAA